MNALIHVYRLDSEVADDLPPTFFACLPDEERRRIAPLRRAQDRRNRRLAYATLFWLLQRHSGVPPERIRLARNRWGKPDPVLPESIAPLHANLSHSADCVLIAIAACPVGVDVEAIRPLDTATIHRALFACDSPEADTPDAFYAAWTAREAALKAMGVGMSLDPAAITPGPGAPKFPHVSQPPHVSHFQALASYPPDAGFDQLSVASLDLLPGYAGAVAVLHRAPRCVLRRLDLADLRSLCGLRDACDLRDVAQC